MDYEQMEIDITLESDRDLKENMQATAKFALGQIMEYQHPTKVKNRHEGYGIAAEGYASLQGKMKSTNKGISTREAADKFIREKMPKESYFQKKILDWIKDNAPNAIAWKEAAGPYSRQGIPDITCIINGRYYGFEVKRPFIGVLSKIQEQTIKQIRRAGGRAWVVTSEKEVAEILLPELTQK